MVCGFPARSAGKPHKKIVMHHAAAGEKVRSIECHCASNQTAYFIEPNRADPMRAQMDRYGAVVREIAATHDAVFVDTQAAFDRVLEQLHPMTLAWDRVHPTLVGHMLLARAFLNAVGY